MALAMKVISQVEAQRKILEEAVSTALELASGKSDGAEVAVSKTTGISVSTRYEMCIRDRCDMNATELSEQDVWGKSTPAGDEIW